METGVSRRKSAFTGGIFVVLYNYGISQIDKRRSADAGRLSLCLSSCGFRRKGATWKITSTKSLIQTALQA